MLSQIALKPPVFPMLRRGDMELTLYQQCLNSLEYKCIKDLSNDVTPPYLAAHTLAPLPGLQGPGPGGHDGGPKPGQWDEQC